MAAEQPGAYFLQPHTILPASHYAMLPRWPSREHDLVGAFQELGKLAAEAGKVIDLAVYGGSALMLVSNFRDSSWDIDAVASPDQDFIREASGILADRHGWPADWLSDGVRTYLSPMAEDNRSHEWFATYPDEASPGLRVYVPTPEYLLAMKLMALRVEPSGGKDLDDILNLMEVVGIAGKHEIVDAAANSTRKRKSAESFVSL